MAPMWTTTKPPAVGAGADSPKLKPTRKPRSNFFKSFSVSQHVHEPLSHARTTRVSITSHAPAAAAGARTKGPRRQLSFETLFGSKTLDKAGPLSTRHRVMSESESQSQPPPQATLPSIRSLRNKFSISLRAGTTLPPPPPPTRRHTRLASDTARKYLPWSTQELAETENKDRLSVPTAADTSTTLGASSINNVSRSPSSQSNASQLHLRPDSAFTLSSSRDFIFPLPPTHHQTSSRSSEIEELQGGQRNRAKPLSAGEALPQVQVATRDDGDGPETAFILPSPQLNRRPSPRPLAIIASVAEPSDSLLSPLTFGVTLQTTEHDPITAEEGEAKEMEDEDILQLIEERDGQGWWSSSKPTTPSTLGAGGSSPSGTPTRTGQAACDADDRRIKLLEKLAHLSASRYSPRSAAVSPASRSPVMTPLPPKHQLRAVSYGSSPVRVAARALQPEGDPMLADEQRPDSRLQHQFSSPTRRPVLTSRNSWTPGQRHRESRSHELFAEMPRSNTDGTLAKSSLPYLAGGARWIHREDDVGSLYSGGTSTVGSSQHLSTPHTRTGSVMSTTSLETIQSKHALEKDVLIKALMLARSKVSSLQDENGELRELLAERMVENEELKIEMRELREEVDKMRQDVVELPGEQPISVAETRRKHASVSSSIFACPPPDDMSMLVNAKMDIDNVFSSTPAPLRRLLQYTAPRAADSPLAPKQALPARKASTGSISTDVSNILSFAETSFGSEREAGDVSWVLKLRDDDAAFLDDL